MIVDCLYLQCEDLQLVLHITLFFVKPLSPIKSLRGFLFAYWQNAI